MTNQHSEKSVMIKFLKDYQEFGSRGHLVAASAFRERMVASSDIEERKLLAVKIYGEFIAALEDLGALCVAIRCRNESVDLLYSYLTYGQSRNRYAPKISVRKLYKLVLNGESLASALNVPSLNKISKNIPELSATLFLQLYAETDMMLKQVAKTYLHGNGVLVRLYNKTKHGFVVVNDVDIFDLNVENNSAAPGAWIVTGNPKYHPNQNSEHPMVELFLAEESQVDMLVDRITEIRGTVRALCEFTAVLLQQDLITCAQDVTNS